MWTEVIRAGVLDVAFRAYGPADGWPCVLGHGFPYDVHAYADVAPILAEAGARVVVPFLRGFGPTRFLSAVTPRSGEQAALGADLLALMDGLKIERAVLAGYDWGGRAACVASALWPERVMALVSGNSYNIQNIARANGARARRRKRPRSGISTISIANGAAGARKGSARHRADSVANVVAYMGF